MEILSYPVGLLIGLFPVIVDLGGSAQPAELLLDGKPACAISARAPACTVDLGPDPVVHRLELVRRDRAGRVAESVVRWVNKPGVEAEVHASGPREKKTRSCDFTITWAHPGKHGSAAAPASRARSSMPWPSTRPTPRGSSLEQRPASSSACTLRRRGLRSPRSTTIPRPAGRLLAGTLGHGVLVLHPPR